MGLWGRVVTDGGVQIANYNIRDKQQGAWHHDASADISVVIPLNTGEYEGGGTEFPDLDLTISPECGTILIFPATWTYLHRGNTPISNDKYILGSYKHYV